MIQVNSTSGSGENTFSMISNNGPQIDNHTKCVFSTSRSAIDLYHTSFSSKHSLSVGITELKILRLNFSSWKTYDKILEDYDFQ